MEQPDAPVVSEPALRQPIERGPAELEARVQRRLRHEPNDQRARDDGRASKVEEVRSRRTSAADCRRREDEQRAPAPPEGEQTPADRRRDGGHRTEPGQAQQPERRTEEDEPQRVQEPDEVVDEVAIVVRPHRFVDPEPRVETIDGHGGSLKPPRRRSWVKIGSWRTERRLRTAAAAGARGGRLLVPR